MSDANLSIGSAVNPSTTSYSIGTLAAESKPVSSSGPLKTPAQMVRKTFNKSTASPNEPRQSPGLLKPVAVDSKTESSQATSSGYQSSGVDKRGQDGEVKDADLKGELKSKLDDLAENERKLK